MSDNKIIIVGYSGHAYVVLEAAELLGEKIDFYAEKIEAKKNPFSLKYLGFESNEDFSFQDGKYVFILGIGDNVIRQKTANLLVGKNQKILTIIHPEANVSKNISIGDGVFIARGSNVNPFVKIGNYTILNTNCSVDHECIIGVAVHIAPGAVLAGNVKVGNNTLIGANAVINQGITIGSNVIIGAGAVIINDIPNNSKVVGNPGKFI